MLGHAVAAHALTEGHDVTCFARGVAGDAPPGARWVRGNRDDPDGLRPVVEGDVHWDAVVDVSRHPGQVRRAVAALGPVTDRFVLVSTGNVYADHSRPGADETVPLLPPLKADVMADMEVYGAAKVACACSTRPVTVSPVTSPWSAKACIVFSGIVLTVPSTTSSETYMVSA